MNSRRTFLSRALCLSLGAAWTLGSPDAAFAAASQNTPAATAGSGATAAGPARITLPDPSLKGGMPLMQSFTLRRSIRKFTESDLPVQHLSNLLWAAVGINRPDGKRTIPTAMNKQNIIVYAAMALGIWRYVPEKHELLKESDEDIRTAMGGAPLTLGYFTQGKFGGLHAGSAYQNVGLYCASAGLANVVKYTGVQIFQGHVKQPSEYAIQILQSVGVPA